MFPTKRLLENEVEATDMTGVEHLGQYVFEMTKAKIENLKTGGKPLPAIEKTEEVMKMDEEDEGEGQVDAVAEEDDEERDIDAV